MRCSRYECAKSSLHIVHVNFHSFLNITPVVWIYCECCQGISSEKMEKGLQVVYVHITLG